MQFATRFVTYLPVPANFQTFNDLAGYAALHGWSIGPVYSGRPMNEAALVTVRYPGPFGLGWSRVYVYVQGALLDKAYWFWSLSHPGVVPFNVGAAMTYAVALQNNYLWGMHLLMPDVGAADGGFHKYGF